LAYYFWWENKLATGNWKQATEKQSGRKWRGVRSGEREVAKNDVLIE
jgi:hypothetical protein